MVYFFQMIWVRCSFTLFWFTATLALYIFSHYLYLNALTIWTLSSIKLSQVSINFCLGTRLKTQPCKCVVLWMALFSWVPIFVDWKKNRNTFVEFKIRGHSNLFNNYSYRNLNLRGYWNFVDRILNENHENWYPTKLKPSTVTEIPVTLHKHCSISSLNFAATLKLFID